MSSARNLIRRFGNPLEWNSSSRAILLLVLTWLLHVLYALWASSILGLEGVSEAVRVPFVRAEIVTFYTFVWVSGALCLVVTLMSKMLGDSPLYEHVATQYYGLSHCYFAWLIGTLSLPTGIVLAGAPVLGFIFFDRVAVMWAFCNVALTLTLLSVLSVWGVIPYAPVVAQLVQDDGGLSPFWAASYIGFTVPHVVCLFGLAFLVLRRWREREEDVVLMSSTDPLTGLLNRRSILTQLRQEQARSVQQGLPMAVVMLDLDHFKQINDGWGHEAGDYVLIAAADVLQKTVRQNDRIGRYGGEEFLLVLPGAEGDGARRLAERCRQQMEALEVLLSDGQRVQVTASMGLFCNEKDRDVSVEVMLRRADKALYAAKQAGRNRVVVADASFD